MEFFNKNKTIIIAIIVCIAICVAFIVENVLNKNNDNIIETSDTEEVIDTVEQNTSDDKKENQNDFIEDFPEDEKNKIYVYVTGEVVNRGVVILDEGSRISDAIDSCGGVTANADISKINLVFILEDGMKVNIPSREDLKKNSTFEYVTSGSNDGDNKESSSIKNSSVTSSKDSTKVNINTASQTELETLPGIGPSLALNIINYRKENGRFSSIDDVKSVSGIGDSKFDKIKDLIIV